MTQLQILHAAHYHRMPWRNGGGVTREICRYPEQGEFDWRLSIAQVAAGGPFSVFDGYQRIISVLEGAGMHLTVAGESMPPLAPYEAFAFSGDDPVDCRLPGGPMQDFNLIYRPDQYAARFQWLEGLPRLNALLTSAPCVLLFNAGGPFQVECPSHAPVLLEPFDTLRLDNAAQALVALRLPALERAALIELSPR